VSRHLRSFPPLHDLPVRVLVCDDMPDLRELLGYFIERDPGTVLCAEAADGWGALRQAARVTVDVIVLDLGMPGPGPVQVVRRLRRVAPAAAIVLYSGTPAHVLGTERRSLALEIVKGTTPALVVDRVRELGLARRARARRTPDAARRLRSVPSR
jgi:DNA-binding NarL/FixJ family response regulator